MNHPFPCGEVCANRFHVMDEEILGEETSSKPGKFFEEVTKQIDCPSILQRELLSKPLNQWPPPTEIPKDQQSLLPAYNMGGRARMTYMAVQHGMIRVRGGKQPTSAHWNRAEFEELKRLISDERHMRSRGLPQEYQLPPGYEQHIQNLHDALQRHSDGVAGLRGAVWDSKHIPGGSFGSEHPWIEALAIGAGHASSMLSINYNKISTDHPQLRWLRPSTMAKQTLTQGNQTLDFAISFSAVEHAGLGRFGESLNPFGDLEVMAQIWCTLRPGGLLFLSLHTGKDAVIFNAQRIYGYSRLAELAASWIQVDKIETMWEKSTQPLYVLQKPQG